MDIRSLIGPSSGVQDKPEPAPEPPQQIEKQHSLQDGTYSRHSTSSPTQSSRRQTVSSLLNEDESDYLKNRANDHANATTSPLLTSRVNSSPIGERSQSPLAKRPLLDSPELISKSVHTSPHLPKKPRIKEDVTSPRTKSTTPLQDTVVPGASMSSTNTTTTTDNKSPKTERTAIDREYLLAYKTTSEEGNSSPPPLRRESREGDFSTGHLPPKVEPRSSINTTNTHENPSSLPHSLPPPPKPRAASNATKSVQSAMDRSKEQNGSGSNDRKPNGSTSNSETSKGESARLLGMTKPRKYERPPIWAQSYRQLNNMRRIQMVNGPGGRNGDHQRQQISNRAQRPPMQQQQQSPHQRTGAPANYVNNLSQVDSKSGLPLSLTSVLPYEDITRKITEWLYVKLYNLEEQRQYVEVEVKVGQILDKKDDERLNLPITTEAVVNRDYAKTNTHFSSGVSEPQFKTACSFLDSIANETKGTDKPTRIAAMPMTSTRDLFFHNPKSPDNIRQTLNKDGDEVERILKQTVDHLVVFSPGDLLDYRVSISLEIPQTAADVDLSRLKVVNERYKNRLSYVHRAFEVDLTSVTSGPVTSHEIELEINKEMLLGYYDSLARKEKDSSLRFEELVRFTVDNTRLIMRKLSH